MTDQAQVAVPPVNIRFQQAQGSPSVHLDALRGFAAFSVLLFHWRDAFFVSHSKLVTPNFPVSAAYDLTDGGHQWVIVFFVLSGYLVGGSVLRAVDSQRWSWPRYLLARLTRLYVVLIPALLLGAVLDWTGMHLAGTEAVYSGHSGMSYLIVNVHSTLTLPVLAENALFLQGTAPPGTGGHVLPRFGSNGPLWSLSCEFWYYIAFPPMVLLLAKGQSWWVRVFCGLGLAVLVWVVGSVNILWLAIPWITGALLVYLPPVPARGPWMRGTAIGVALTLSAAGLKFDEVYPGFADPLFGLAVAFLIWVILYCATAPLPAGYVRLAQRAARSSYTLYLVHFPMLVFLKASLHLPFAVPGWYTFLVGVGLLAVVLVYAQLIYELFEKHTDQVRKWLQPYVMHREPS
jgi:peptidoglycan/LPS O-acetylase OafA/YrhL